MASMLANCLGRLVTSKRITQKQADDALALHEGIQDRLYPAMPPASAEAASALEAARTMAQAAKVSIGVVTGPLIGSQKGPLPLVA